MVKMKNLNDAYSISNVAVRVWVLSRREDSVCVLISEEIKPLKVIGLWDEIRHLNLSGLLIERERK